METYTLQRFYHEAKALLEKYQALKDEYSLNVGFEIEEANLQSPRLRCTIWYKHRGNYNSPDYYASATTPANSLNEFEEKLQAIKGKTLINSVAAEIE